MSFNVYDGSDNPYVSWLEVTTEKDLLEAWLKANVPYLNVTRGKRHISVLDMGCSWGSTSLRLMRVLRDQGIGADYTGVDPSQAQLDTFARSIHKSGIPQPTLIASDLESFVPNRRWNLVFASHMLYYMNDMTQALQRLVDLSDEIIVVHHGQRGIHTLHQAFRDVVQPGAHIISTDDDVARCLERIDLHGRSIARHFFTSTVDIVSCLDPDSLQGRNLLTFFFERPYDTIPPRDLGRIRRFMHETFAPSFRMLHDDSVFVVS